MPAAPQDLRPVPVYGYDPTNGAGALAVATPTPASFQVGQQAVTASAAPLPASSFVNGFTLKAKVGNVGPVFVGKNGVTTAYTGTGAGFPLEAGASITISAPNMAAFYIVGTAADVVSFIGN